VRPLLFRQKPQCRAHASRTSLQLRLGVSKRLVEVYGVRGSAESKLNYVVPRQEACLEFAHLFLDQMTSVISKPNLGSRRRGHDFELVVLCFGSSRWQRFAQAGGCVARNHAIRVVDRRSIINQCLVDLQPLPH